MNVRRLILIASGVLLIAGVNALSQLPARPTARPMAQVPQGSPDSELVDPEQEGTNDVNRILRDIHLIKEFLGLTEEQMGQLRPVLEASYPDLLALYRELHILRRELHGVLGQPSPPPGQVGQLLVDIREVEAQIVEIRRIWGEAIEAVLNEEQLGQLRRIRRLARILPAFRGVGLIPAPTDQPEP